MPFVTAKLFKFNSLIFYTMLQLLVMLQKLLLMLKNYLE